MKHDAMKQALHNKKSKSLSIEIHLNPDAKDESDEKKEREELGLAPEVKDKGEHEELPQRGDEFSSELLKEKGKEEEKPSGLAARVRNKMRNFHK